jgi:hypothetical protein
MMLALAILSQAAVAQAPLTVQRDRLLEAYWATNGPDMTRCETPPLQTRLAAAKADLDRLLGTYRARAAADGTWQAPPVFPVIFFPCEKAEGKVAALEAAIASFKQALEGA